MDFKDIATKVIDNAELKKALMNYLEFVTPNKNDSVLVPYENLIMFQASESVHPIREAGYQVGEPWSGDIENAVLPQKFARDIFLFLAKNQIIIALP